jgi:hypothetical protein
MSQINLSATGGRQPDRPVEPDGAPTPDHEVVFLLNFFDELR